MQGESTVLVEPGCLATVTDAGDLRIAVGNEVEEVEAAAAAGGAVASAAKRRRLGVELDPIQLSIFSHRFMGIAEQMGRTLQRTSISVNIKERLDFSCALFGPDGGLVANAPHLPVHLGAMQAAVRFQVAHWDGSTPGRAPIKPGDVLVSNHPQLAGGSHLPDITVITPVFAPGASDAPQFFVASRGHHADVGGITPGSMPALSKSIVDEGAAIIAFKLVDGASGLFQEEGIAALLMAPAAIPGNSGSRNLADNLSDLRAQVAANQRGVVLMDELIGACGLDVVVAYMGHIQRNCEQAVRSMLRAFAAERGGGEGEGMVTVRALDRIDDGTPIALKVTVDGAAGTAAFDFSGTGPQILGNLNAPPAVTSSAVIYCLRCLLGGGADDIPLNEGCLAPVTIHIPEGCLLNPGPMAAVVGGNVLTSQRVTDVVLQAFGACASSQGCMNNLTFGDATFGYYETIAGGAGAGPGWEGRSGVHTHMTNTRITDPEILERRYPVLLRRFELRPGTGGAGAFRGGDGVVRELEFLTPLTVGVLCERRAFAPPGMAGGGDAARGINLLVRGADGGPGGELEGEMCNVGGKNTFAVAVGDRLQIFTPGGGGYGAEGSSCAAAGASPAKGGGSVVPVRTSGSVRQWAADQETG
jgi:5-oxoprolinase (ATP-hydrolysing)